MKKKEIQKKYNKKIQLINDYNNYYYKKYNKNNSLMYILNVILYILVNK